MILRLNRFESTARLAEAHRTYLTLEWRERGVRIDELTPTPGFGSKVIEQSFPHMLGGAAELIFNPDGVACRLEFPLPVRARESYDG
jgi:two-component sensor histidine kinase